MQTILVRSLIALLISAMMCGAAWAQATAHVSGAVQDESGAVLPGVEVTATQTQTGISRMTVSNEIGIYTLPEMEIPFAGMDEVVCEIGRVAGEIVNREKFPLVLGGEHSITPPIVAAV